MAVTDMVPLIFAGVNGLLDTIPVDKILTWESDLLAHLKSSHPEIQATIEKEGQVSKETEATLKKTISAFNSTFNA